MSTPLATSQSLHERVRDEIARGGPTPETFDALANEIARFQAANVPTYGRLCAARGVDVSRDGAVGRLPALPTDAFRYARIAAHPAELDVRVFRTSGTSRGAELRGAHPLRTLETYEAAALAWARPHLLSGPLARAIVLVPDPAIVPDSSLGFMVGLFVERLGLGTTRALSGGGVDLESALCAADEARKANEPTIVFSTAFALAHVLGACSTRDLTLPAGSRVMVTGGFKGRTREVPSAELYEGAARAFGVPLTSVIGEYGMTELSSQLYEARGGEPPGVYRPPPWLRVSAADPITLEPLPHGHEGIARFVDLANVDSCAFVQTLDWVAVDERGWVKLFGRAPGAEPRGCSLAIEDLFGAEGERPPGA